MMLFGNIASLKPVTTTKPMSLRYLRKVSRSISHLSSGTPANAIRWHLRYHKDQGQAI